VSLDSAMLLIRRCVSRVYQLDRVSHRCAESAPGHEDCPEGLPLHRIALSICLPLFFSLINDVGGPTDGSSLVQADCSKERVNESGNCGDILRMACEGAEQIKFVIVYCVVDGGFHRRWCM